MGGNMCCADIAGRVHRESNWIGSIILPHEFVLVVRVAITLGSLFLRI